MTSRNKSPAGRSVEESPTSSVPSQSSSSSSQPSYLSRNLPLPPPPDRALPPKSKSVQNPHPKFKLLRKGKDKRRDSVVVDDDDDDWTLEGTPHGFGNGHGNGNGNRVGHERESLELERPIEDQEEMLDSQLTEVPEMKKEKKKHRGLVKKTSQLFSRKAQGSGPSSDLDSSDAATPLSSSSLNPPALRQSSYSSSTSGESHTTNGSSIRHLAPFSRTLQRNPSSPSKHVRRPSADSWSAPPPRSSRSGSASTYDSPPEIIPIPRQSSNLSASVPGLSRHSLPQPVPPSSNTTNSATLGPRSADNFPSRMSTWFSHLLPSASTTVSEDQTQSSHLPPSPLRRPPSTAAVFLNAAKQKAVGGVRYLLDSEAVPDKCEEPIWVLGVGHPGWRPSTPSSMTEDLADPLETVDRRGSNASGRSSPPQPNLRPPPWGSRKQKELASPPSKGFGNLFNGSTISLALPGGIGGSPSKESDRAVSAESPSKSRKDKRDKEVLKWPDQFHDDFRSRVWMTYRSQYAPILSLPQSLLIPTPKAYYSAFSTPADLKLPTPNLSGALPSRPSSSPWTWTKEERGLTSDAGWGCMLRTGQSMLANSLIHLHLGRGWRLPIAKPEDAEGLEAYATYVKILSWFMDDPSPLCPFSVHRMALIGKELGKEVGEWFGPSTASGALKTLANSFPICGLAVATAVDNTIYKSDVYSASNLPSDGWDELVPPSQRRLSGVKYGKWGDKAVLIMVGMRLGLDAVNPMYYDTIKALFTIPQSVGIAGGRPSSSYYFVGSQANSLFYLDPHFTRAAIPLEIPPQPINEEPSLTTKSSSSTLPYTLDVVNVDDVSDDSDSEDGSDTSSPLRRKRPMPKSTPPASPVKSVPKTPETPSTPMASTATPNSIGSITDTPKPAVDFSTDWYANAYHENQLRTFHCDRVKKLPLSGLDPSMLLGFLCRSEDDFDDFVERVSSLPQKIFTVADEPPTWDDDDETGLESVSEPDMDHEVPPSEEEDLTIVRATGTPDDNESWAKLDKTKAEKPINRHLHHTRPSVATVRQRTDSWIEPPRGGQEAPNGDSII
ncbi:cysteine protease ATG4, partial [Tremellales sp. Uapishka_1]